MRRESDGLHRIARHAGGSRPSPGSLKACRARPGAEALEGRLMLSAEVGGYLSLRGASAPPALFPAADLLAATASAPAATLTGTGLDITARTGQSTIDVPVATFTKDSPTEWAQGSIDWGDGSPVEDSSDPGGIPLDPGQATFEVHGHHTYARAGTYTITVTVVTPGDGRTATATGTATVADDANVPSPILPGTGIAVTARTGASTLDVPVATFTIPQAELPETSDPLVLTPKITIDWGDGTPASIQAVPLNGTFQDGAGAFTITGRHTYAQAATYTIHTSYSIGVLQGSVTSTATVSDDAPAPPGLGGTGLAVTAQAGVATADVPLASFTPAPGIIWAQGTIDWGDGSPIEQAGGPAGGIPLSPGQATFEVDGQHTYARAGTYTITVKAITPGDGRTGTATSTATVAGAAPAPPAVTVQAIGTGADLTAQAGAFVKSGGASPATVATFFVPRPAGDDEPWVYPHATIDWGDGTPAQVEGLESVTTAVAGGWEVQVSGTHAYADAGTYTTLVTFTAVGNLPFSAAGTATGSVTVTGDAGPTAHQVLGSVPDEAARAGVNSLFHPLATFSFPQADIPLGGLTHGTVQVDWGDGSPPSLDPPTSQGDGPYPGPDSLEITGEGGGVKDDFIVDGGHTYARAGTYTITATFTVAGLTVTATGTAIVTDGPVAPPSGTGPGGPIIIPIHPPPAPAAPPVTARGLDVTSRAGSASGFVPVAAFSTAASRPGLVVGAVTIHWGDGTVSPGIAAGRTPGRNGGLQVATVAGRHAYAKPGKYVIRVTTVVDGVRLTSTSTATVAAAVAAAPGASGGGSGRAPNLRGLLPWMIRMATRSNPWGSRPGPTPATAR